MQPDGLLANRIPQSPDRRLRQDEAIEMESQPSCSRLQIHLPQFSRCLVVFVNIPENEIGGNSDENHELSFSTPAQDTSQPTKTEAKHRNRDENKQIRPFPKIPNAQENQYSSHWRPQQ